MIRRAGVFCALVTLLGCAAGQTSSTGAPASSGAAVSGGGVPSAHPSGSAPAGLARGLATGDSLIEAGKLMWDSKVGCLPVVDVAGKVVGIITEADFIAVALELLGSQITKSDIEELARSPRKSRTPLAM